MEHYVCLQRRAAMQKARSVAFTTGLMHAAQAHGAVLRHGTVVDLVRSPSGAVRGVALAGGEIVESDAVVISPRTCDKMYCFL